MIINNSLEIFDLGLYIKDLDAVVISDTHFGFEEALNNIGVFIPRFHYEDIVSRVKKIFDLIGKKVSTIIVNGDLKHVFGHISSQENKDILKFIDFLKEFADRIIIVKGNHDIMLDYIVKKRDIVSVDNFCEGGFFITHGHLLPDKEVLKDFHTVIIGNEHSAVSLSDDVRMERFKCFLSGSWKDKKLIVIPSFHNLSVGSDVLSGNFLSPYLHQDISDFDVFVVDEEVYFFGKVKNLR